MQLCHHLRHIVLLYTIVCSSVQSLYESGRLLYNSVQGSLYRICTTYQLLVVMI
jgi:hypothetical protein